ncbi:MAG: pyruvate:ferredoxin (flavodoxin) oxidoreductase [Gammaproteobacteria bacterium]|nr:pyruvate:ferredoxin (flavodoxin) oxidoreductase [Gammaproteobacteria bacterium]
MARPNKTREVKTIDGSEAVAHVAYRVNEVCAIYPITPSSPMAEFADQWSAEGKPNIWGNIPTVIEMQSEGGAAGTAHGALQTGSLTTTFTASQGLMLMIPNMYKIAGELTCAVFHVAARSLAAQGLSIFGDHQDVMAVRSTGFAQLASNSPQEAQDMALIAQAATLNSRIPFIHFFDGFRTSHEVNRVEMLDDDDIRSMIDDDLVLAHRERGLNPDHPFIRGTAQNPDVYFQGRETVNPFYAKTAAIVQEQMDKFAELTGRQYKLFEYFGDPKAEKVIVIMGSGAETAHETVEYLLKQGEKIGVLKVRLYRPFSTAHLISSLPLTVKAIAVLDRTKEPGAAGEPLYQDIITTLAETQANGELPFAMPKLIGGRYGLSSKEFTPAMVKGVLDELSKAKPKNHFTIGINDDVSHTSLDYDPNFITEPNDVVRALFYGLGADGTVGANKNSIKIIGELPGKYAQGYFVYDSKKSGSQTVSHLRFGPNPIRSTYLVQSANFVACHQNNFIDTTPLLKHAAKGATFLLNSTHGPNEVWDTLPLSLQQQIIEKETPFYVIDAYKVARENGMGTRINTVMQTCFFAISGVLPKDEAIEQIKYAIKKTYGKKGEEVVKKNFQAVDESLAHLHEVKVPKRANSKRDLPAVVPDNAPDFVKNVTAMMMAGRGDELPVSAMPIDGTFPSATTKWEKRNIALFVPEWDPETCIQCGNCALVCPHGCIRSKLYDKADLASAPKGFKAAKIDARGFPDTRYTLQVYVEDCTGCGLCVEVCPAKNKEQTGRKAINMHVKEPILETAKANTAFFEKLPEMDRSRVDFSTVRGVQFLQPLFEFSGACAGCGETPYVKLLSQLFGDRLLVANATGCSSIYGGNLPTTPWATNSEGRGPAWSNSLFEDNAEFGLGFRVSADKQRSMAVQLLEKLRPQLSESLGDEMIDDLLNAPQLMEMEIRAQRARVVKLKERLQELAKGNGFSSDAKHLLSVADQLVRRSIWIVGGDGWAYDIGSSGLDHVMASGRDVNILVMDTEVYSNTGGQSSKATPLGAVAKFAAGGKSVGKKDLALQAISYGSVYVARIAYGANPQQTLQAMREAEAYPGPSLILAYSHCISHGINMLNGLKQQDLAVESGYWPLVRYNPQIRDAKANPFVLDSPRPRIGLRDYAYNELRYKMLVNSNPVEAERLMKLAEKSLQLRWSTYEEMATRPADQFQPTTNTPN